MSRAFDMLKLVVGHEVNSAVGLMGSTVRGGRRQPTNWRTVDTLLGHVNTACSTVNRPPKKRKKEEDFSMIFTFDPLLYLFSRENSCLQFK